MNSTLLLHLAPTTVARKIDALMNSGYFQLFFRRRLSSTSYCCPVMENYSPSFEDTIANLCNQNRLKDAVNLLDRVKNLSATTYSTLLQSCLRHCALEEGRRVHSHITDSNFIPGIVISNRIINMYLKCGSLRAAQKVFDEMPVRDTCSSNILINGYAKLGKLETARKVFDEMSRRDGFSWTAIISCYVQHGRSKEALDLFREMWSGGNLECSVMQNNKFTLSSVVAAVAAIPSLVSGKEIHGHIVRMGSDVDSAVWSALSNMYAKCGNIDEARRIFDRIVDRDVVTWTAIVDRYFEDGRWEEGFALLSDMIMSGIKPNEFTFAGVLNACAHQAVENVGKQVHGHMIRTGFDPDSFAATALVHMYSKCGNVKSARKAFEGVLKPDVASWTSLIAGYAQNGEAGEALKLFELMLQSGIRPDHVTFVSVLSACTHTGMVETGMKYFHSIKDVHGLTPIAEHYACLIDLLCRAARFTDAEDYINKMPMKPTKFLWSSLLGGCRIHKNIELAERAANALFKIEPENAATYTTLANIYATAGRWVEVAKVRKMMDDRGVVKTPGMSWIEVKRQVHRFLVGDTSHPSHNQINDFLREVSKKMREEGYVPDTNFVLHDVEEEQKEHDLSYHSEKLAVAFGIISTSPRTPVKDELLGLVGEPGTDPVFKNHGLNMDVLYRSGETQEGALTYTPRLVSVNYQGTLGSMSSYGTLYNQTPESPPPVATWRGSVSIQRSQRQKRNLFLQHLYEEEQIQSSSMGTGQADSQDDNQDKNIVDSLEMMSIWTDFSKVHYHPQSLYELTGSWMGVEEFNNYGAGKDVFAEGFRGEEMNERLHFFLEECDHIQGIQFLVDDSGGFSSVAENFLQNIADEYANTPVMLYTVRDPRSHMNSTSRKRNISRDLHDAVSFAKLSPLCKLIVPVGLPSLGNASPHLRINDGNPYHCSAVYAAALHSLSLPFCMDLSGPAATSSCTYGALDVNSIVQTLSGQHRQNIVAILDATIPAPCLTGKPAEEPILSKLRTLTPEVSECAEDMQSVEALVINGALQSGGQRASISEVEQAISAAYEQATTRPRFCHLSVATCPLPIPLPFPSIFSDNVSQNGQLLGTPNPNSSPKGSIDVHSIPMAARLRSSNAVLPFLSNRLENLRTLGIQRGALGGELLKSWGFGREEVEEMGETLSNMIRILDPSSGASSDSD